MATLHAQRSPVETFDNVFDAVSDAHRCSGFEAGYRRALNDVIAELALVAAEVGRERPEGREALRVLRRRFEEWVDGPIGDRAAGTEGYVDGGLGI